MPSGSRDILFDNGHMKWPQLLPYQLLNFYEHIGVWTIQGPLHTWAPTLQPRQACVLIRVCLHQKPLQGSLQGPARGSQLYVRGMEAGG